MVTIKTTKNYFDIVLNRKIRRGETIETTKERAEIIVNAGFGEVIKIINVPEEEVQKKVDAGFEKAKTITVEDVKEIITPGIERIQESIKRSQPKKNIPEEKPKTTRKPRTKKKKD